MRDDLLVWIDLEMTGLDIKTCSIIEIATVITDTDLNIIAEGPNLAIQCSEEKIVLHSISIESGKMLVDINIEDLTEYSINEGEIIKLSFSLNMLHNICMYNKISKEIVIFLTKDYPMKVVYHLGEDNANFTFYLAPKISDDD